MMNALQVFRNTIALLVFAVGSIATPARAQIPTPSGLPVAIALDELARAGVRAPSDRVLAAYATYLDGFGEALQMAVTGAGPDYAARFSGSGTAPSVADVRRNQELEALVADAEIRLRNQFFDAIADAGRPEDRKAVDAVRLRHAILQTESRLQGELSVHHYANPDDIGGWLLWSPDKSVPASEFRHRLMLATTNGDARIAALVAARKRLLALEMEQAKESERGKSDGGSAHEGHWNRGRYSPGPEILAPGSEFAQKLLQAQLDTYRLVLPELTDAERASIKTYWIPRMVGVGWLPNGMPQLYAGSHNVGTYVTELTRCRGLDDAARAKIRELGRAWVKDDVAIIDRAMDRLLASGKVEDVAAARDARTRKAREAFARVKGLEWLADPNAELPGDLLPVDQADAKEFGLSFASEARPPTGDGEEDAVAPGLPVGYSRRNELALGDTLRLSDEQRQVLGMVLADARERWTAQVQPFAAAARSQDDHEYMRAPTAESLDRRRATIEARGKAWTAAAKLDAETFVSLAAALGDRIDARSLVLVRAARVAGRVPDVSWRLDEQVPVDVASRILETPVSAAGRTASLAAALPNIESWMEALRAADEQRMAADLADIEAQRPLLSEPTRTQDGRPIRVHRESPESRAAKQATVEKRAACNAIAAALEESVLAAVQGADLSRYRASFAAMRRPDVLGDPLPLWTAIERALACAPAAQREALRAAIAPTLAEFEERFDRMAKLGLQLPKREPRKGDGVYDDVYMQLRSCSGSAPYLAGAQLDAILPPECWRDAPGPKNSNNLSKILARLAGDHP